MKSRTLFLLFLLSIFVGLRAEIKVASVLGDNMVLQRNSEVKLWGKANANEKLVVKTDWNKLSYRTIANEKGYWLVKVKTTEAGGPYTIEIKSKNETCNLKNILLGEVWICSGQSNMQMPINGYTSQPINGMIDILLDAQNNKIRLFTVGMKSIATSQDTCRGSWSEANAQSVGSFSAVGYLFAKQLYQALNIPIGMISTNWGGSRIEAWMKNDVITGFADAFKQTTQEKTQPNQRASYLYNGMIAPIVNYNIKGAIWYQGESNKDNYQDYAALQAAMVKSWRTDFGVGDFPFYFVQIAHHNYGNSKGTISALLREAQYNFMAIIPNSGMVSTIDLGEERSIHPAEKITVAKRLALWALSETYSVKGLPYKSPVYKSMVVKDSVAILTFDNTPNGFTTNGKIVESFEVAGQDSVFYPAKLTVSQKQARISSPKVKTPVAVRYSFCNFPTTSGFLYNTAGLPVLPFRTDNWNNK